MPHPTPTPLAKNLDADLWDSGYNNARSLGNPVELDFLRGFHNLASLTLLRNWLQANSGSNIRLTSVWQDKYGNVVPNPLAPGQHYNYQEVADLAVIVRDAHNSQASAWMWLLQAKVVSNSSAPLPAGNSTSREIYLYESMPDFTWHGKQSLKYNFQLKNDFKSPSADYKHWSFLCFRDNAMPCPSNKFIDVRWPGSSSGGLSVTSFCDELLELVTHFSVRPVPANVYGAPLEHNPEWEMLAKQILHKAQLKPQFGHASKAKGQKADVLICAMLAERYAGTPIWLDARGNQCKAGCDFCFPGACSDDISYSFISTGFDEYQPNFDLSRDMQEKWDTAEEESRYWKGDKWQGDGGREPPRGGDQRDGEDGGAGAKLTLFVDVASTDAGKLRD